MAAPSMVFTARFAARHFGVDIDGIKELAAEMAPENGCLSVIDSFDDDAESATAFTRHGLDCLDQRCSDFMRESLPAPMPSADAYPASGADIEWTVFHGGRSCGNGL